VKSLTTDPRYIGSARTRRKQVTWLLPRKFIDAACCLATSCNIRPLRQIPLVRVGTCWPSRCLANPLQYVKLEEMRRYSNCCSPGDFAITHVLEGWSKNASQWVSCLVCQMKWWLWIIFERIREEAALVYFLSVILIFTTRNLEKTTENLSGLRYANTAIIRIFRGASVSRYGLSSLFCDLWLFSYSF
jgi:hypothetical protein